MATKRLSKGCPKRFADSVHYSDRAGSLSGLEGNSYGASVGCSLLLPPLRFLVARARATQAAIVVNFRSSKAIQTTTTLHPQVSEYFLKLTLYGRGVETDPRVLHSTQREDAADNKPAHHTKVLPRMTRIASSPDCMTHRTGPGWSARRSGNICERVHGGVLATRTKIDTELTIPAATQSPVVKSEPVTVPRAHPSSIAGDWPLFQPGVDEAFNFYTSPAPTPLQPIPVVVQPPEPRELRRFHQAETPAPPSGLGAMRNTGARITATMSPAHAQGSLHRGRHTNANARANADTNTNTNTTTSTKINTNPHPHPIARRAAAGNFERTAARRYPNVAKRSDTETPEFSGEILGHQGFHNQQQQHDQTRYYESLRHSNPSYYTRPRAALPPISRSPSTYFNYAPADIDAMSLSYETRTFPTYPQSLHEDPQEQDDNNMQHARYPSPPPPLSENPYNAQGIDASPGIIMEMPELPAKEESDAPSPGRSRPIPKPDREVTKGEDGRFVCTWVGCVEEVTSFNRKCEWSKHMDKHDRPYKCPAEGCEKLPGFTYSGGLLRHQREVHNLHGGPRKQLNCPHPNCKRHSGKGFSRQENLNEHLRRVHTDAEQVENGGGGGGGGGDETEDDASERAGMKRKRGPGRGDDADLRTEMARLRTENEELRRQSELQNQQTQELMRQLQNLQALVGSRIGQGQAPQAMM
ncbi:uncharacterized protein BP5553_03541 [Venustampulla echinocandica]|uniref:C2H2-type domain-containing protein n=1 Tax=Venustampulla echinocandica TaxID=2656787 RepID=A0A370TUJ2_9HELO|nr:uncharacterized protein BP5553_03541 [Venustampulla echinocandica]RDL39201.1 hypothetical protein BP5553_03541 [Venustampulla echinocandica]